MADEIELRFTIDAPARTAMDDWRTNPPEPVKDARLELIDRTLETLIYEARYTDRNMKLMNLMSFGLGPKTEAIWRLTVRFDLDGDFRCQVTAIGRLDPKTRAALGLWAQQHGAIVFAAGAA
jgi:hypothetical protein